MKLPADNLFFGLRSKMTAEQEAYVEAIFNKTIVFSNSKAGTGKTTLAVACARYLVQSPESNINGLLYLFNPIEEGEMGYRPGTQKEKEEAYLGPLKNALAEIGEQPDIIYKQGSWVEARSHTFDRGINISNKFVIIDEAQNWTKKDLKKMLTRCHDSCKVVVIGHTGQIDLEDESRSGFQAYINHFAGQEKAAIVNLTKNFRGWLASYADLLE